MTKSVRTVFPVLFFSRKYDKISQVLAHNFRGNEYSQKSKKSNAVKCKPNERTSD